MPRPSKPKRICRLPACTAFYSQRGQTQDESAASPPCPSGSDRVLYLLVEEYEAIRLIDYQGLSQEACAAQMGIARTTAQSLYADGRRKLARFLVEGLRLEIRGGNFALCSACRQDGRRDCPIQPTNLFEQGVCDKAMKIAVTYENGQIFQHFGHTEAFKIYTVEGGKVLSSQICPTNGSGHGALAGFLRAQGVDTLICGGIGGGARNALAEAGIDLYPGAAGDADAQVLSFLAGKLSYQPDIVCSHHHQEGGHDCSHHSCGQEGCDHGKGDQHHCGQGDKRCHGN